jgi:hypothetical protein
MTGRRDVPDYARPSLNVERRADAEWQWGVTHTLRTERLGPIVSEVEYSITVKVQRIVRKVDPATMFAGLYARATAIAGARCHTSLQKKRACITGSCATPGAPYR